MRIEKQFPNPVHGDGLNCTYDASAEVIILYDYLKKNPEFLSEYSDIFERISKFSSLLTE